MQLFREYFRHFQGHILNYPCNLEINGTYAINIGFQGPAKDCPWNSERGATHVLNSGIYDTIVSWQHVQRIPGTSCGLSLELETLYMARMQK